jgi:hypothetical protein
MATRRQLSQNNRENEKLTRECEELTNRQQVSYAPIYFSWKWGHPCPVHSSTPRHVRNSNSQL